MNGIGKDGWLKYHFGGHPIRVDLKSNLTVIPSLKATREVDFHTARLEVAEDIKRFANGRPIFVGMSGGMDSEIVAQSFIDIGVEIQPIITKIMWYDIECNYGDIWWAHRWCKKNNIKPIVFTTSVTDMLVSSLAHAKKIRARKLYSIMNVTNAQYAKSQGGVFVNGQALIEYYPEVTLDYIVDNLRDPSLTNKTGWLTHECDYYIDMDDPGYHPYNFLSWTPEIVLSIASARNLNLNSEDNKTNLTGCEPRPKLGMPDVTLVYFTEAMRKIRETYGTSEVYYFGTHEEFLKQLT